MHDAHLRPEQLEIDAQVRSGYYFVTLATVLETIAQKLADDDRRSPGFMLDKLIADMEYLDSHYMIVKQPNRGRHSL